MPEDSLYVLKLRHDRPAWRVTLEELRCGGHWEFASLELCLSFIAQQHAVAPLAEQSREDDRIDPLLETGKRRKAKAVSLEVLE